MMEIVIHNKKKKKNVFWLEPLKNNINKCMGVPDDTTIFQYRVDKSTI